MDALDEQKSVRLRQRLWGAAVLLALLVIFLPLLLDGSGSESQYRRVERLRAEPPRIINAEGVSESTLDTPSKATAQKVNSELSQNADGVQGIEIVPELQSTNGEQDLQNVEQNLQNIADEIQRGQRQLDVQENQGAQGQQDTQDTQGAQNGVITRNGQVAEQRQKADAALAERAESNANTDAPLNRPTASDSVAQGTESGDSEAMSAWVVQAGSFADEQNALAVRDRLRRAGYPSFVTPTQTTPPVYRVRVGPMIDLARAEDSRDKVMDYLGREAIIVSYP